MLDPNIILSGVQPDLGNAFARGQARGALGAEIRNTNAMRDLLQEQGPNILAGDQNALNALSRFDPQAALGVQDSRLQVQQRELALTEAKETARLRAQTVAAGLSAQERAAEAAQLDRALAMATQAQTPEQFDAAMRAAGADDLVGQFENRDLLIAGALGLKEALEFNKGPEPQSPEGKFAADQRAGLLPSDARRGSDDQSAKEEQIGRLMEGGLDRNTAIAIVDGRVKVATDAFGNISLVDAAQFPLSPPGQGQQGAQAPAAPSAQGQAPSFSAVPVPAQNDGVARDFSGSTGIPGLVRSIQNAASSAAGQDLPAPEVENAINTLNALNRDTMAILSSSLEGRPSVFSQEQIQAFLPQSTGIFQGPERTLSRARETRAAIQRDIETTMQVANGSGQFTPATVSQARQRLLALRTVAGQWDAIVQGLQLQTPPQGRATGPRQAPSGITFEVLE